MKEAGVHFVVRLNTARNPTFTDKEGRKITLSLGQGERGSFHGVYYRGEVKVNVGGVWEKGHAGPLWVITDIDPQEALSIYRKRMKIEESFRDLKSVFGLERLMNKTGEYMEGMVALVLLSYAIGLVLGEELGDELYGGTGRWWLYSGLFVLLVVRPKLQASAGEKFFAHALSFFRNILSPPSQLMSEAQHDSIIT